MLLCAHTTQKLYYQALNEKPPELDPNHLRLPGKFYVWVRYVTAVSWVKVATASNAMKQGTWNLY